MSLLLQYFLILPLAGFLIVALLPKLNEKPISVVAILCTSLFLICNAAFIVYWLYAGHPVLNITHVEVYNSGNNVIRLELYFDKITAVFSLIGAFITFLVVLFSKYYLHRDEGFKRFFTITLLFFFAYNLIVFSGNFETLFTGWEILGLSSFLLITFYRDRFLPAKNGFKVLSVYRLGDICLILAMWMSHHVWHSNISFIKLADSELLQSHLAENYWPALFISIALIIAAATKSAQVPFTSWLPRAMEGPTSSSAVFYGALSVHIGVFLLLRTYAYWEPINYIKWSVVGIGIVTTLLSASMARVQSSVKSQIAYSSSTQIGIIFIEVALGFHILALVHFACNAFLRTYQLLVSPSVLSYRTHDMMFSYKPTSTKPGHPFMDKIKKSIYVLSIKEWNLDTFQYRFLWSPFKWIGRNIFFLTNNLFIVLLTLIFITGLYIDLFPSKVSHEFYVYLPAVFAGIGLLLTLRSFTERKNALRAWVVVLCAQFFLSLSIALLHPDSEYRHILIFLSGSVVASIIGLICLKHIISIDGKTDLNQYHGHSYKHPWLTFLFLLSCLGMLGFPITPTFIGMDLLFTHIHYENIPVLVFTSLSFIFIELSVIRIYNRVFLGQHKTADHPIAYKSS
ncbi:MAG: proton-conducting transporter membrane subunit [Flavobacteriales bacterium]